MAMVGGGGAGVLGGDGEEKVMYRLGWRKFDIFFFLSLFSLFFFFH